MRLVVDNGPREPDPERMCINCSKLQGKTRNACAIDGQYIGYCEAWDDRTDCPYWESIKGGEVDD